MKLGDIVAVKADSRLLGEVTCIDNKDRVEISLCDTGVEIIVDIANVTVTGKTKPKRESGKTVNILGTPYSIVVIPKGDYRYDKEADGYMDPSVKKIFLYNFAQSLGSVQDLVGYQKKVLRHEIVHAFLYESGLWQDSYGSKCWAQNEEMVDWLAIQVPKIHKAFKEAGAL